MQALSLAEQNILKSRLQAGPDGHSQQVILTALNAAQALHNPYYVSATVMPNGQAGLLLRGLDYPYTVATEKVYFIGYDTEHQIHSTVKVFNFSSNVLGLATYYPANTVVQGSNNGIVVAVAYESATNKIWMSISTDNGSSWSVPSQVPAAVTFTDNQMGWNGNLLFAALALRTNKAGDKLYLFFINNATKKVKYRYTTDPSPYLGWSAESDSGFTIPSVRRNGGGSSAANQNDTRSYVIVETKTAGTWVIGAESDDGDWHANHAFFQGTLGGAWTRKLNDGYGGGLSGGQGSNGGLFLDVNGDVIGYAMDDGGGSLTWWRSTDSGATWSSGTEVALSISQKTNIGGIGQGDGLYISAFSAKYYIWGGQAGLNLTPEAANRLLVEKIDVTPVANIAAITINGLQTTSTLDVSDRVELISTDKNLKLDASTFEITLNNEDQSFDINNAAGPHVAFIKPNVLVDIYQWYGAVANKLQTFHGDLDSIRQHDTPRKIVMTGRDLSKKLLVQHVDLIGPQDLSVAGYIRNTSNFVYLNKTLNEVLTHILNYAGIPSSQLAFAPSTFVFKELRGSDQMALMDLVKRACDLGGVEFWCDEVGIFRTLPYNQARDSSWTFRAYEDITMLDPDVDDDDLRTRVRVLGKANVGAKYLSELFKWPGPKSTSGPAGVAYDITTKKVWVLTQDASLYLLDPNDNMSVSSGPYATGLSYPDGISVDPVDNNLWLSDGFDSTVGNNANRKFKKVSRTDGTTVILGPYTNPQGDHCAIWAWDSGAGVIKLKMTTFTGGRIYTMVATTGAEDSHVTSPVALPTALTSDTGGGLFLSGWDATDFYQVDFAGSIVNTIKQDSKNMNCIGAIEDPVVYDFGSIYAAYRDANLIVKYEPVTPSGVETSTYAEVIDSDLEQQLGGEVRRAIITDLAVTDKAMAQRVAQRQLDKVHLYAKHTSMGAIGNPATQANDRVTIKSPSTGIDSDWVVTSVRAEQKDGGTYLMVLIVVPYIS